MSVTSTYTRDQDGAKYRRLFERVETTYGAASITVEAFRKDPEPPGQTHWLWGVYSVVPSTDEDAAPVAMEWHAASHAFYVGAVGYRRMRDAAGRRLL
jgi:hypothetical protein